MSRDIARDQDMVLSTNAWIVFLVGTPDEVQVEASNYVTEYHRHQIAVA